MAVYRPSIACPFCGRLIHFRYNEAPENFIGDAGGDYEPHTCKPEEMKNFPVLTEEQKAALEKLAAKINKK